jgi:endonuclease/exonuclease/phosphatase (EEP) superfamily protein YafD
LKNKIRSFLIAASWLMFVFFLVWVLFSLLTHGYFVWVSIVNMFAFQFFILLIPFVVIGVIYRVRSLQIASLIAAGLFLLIFGKFFIPKQKSPPLSDAVLRVMTYNMLVYAPEVHAVTDVIREENADVVFIQETSFAMVEILENEMRNVYPYQIHQPSDIPDGLSVISKYPFEEINYILAIHGLARPSCWMLTGMDRLSTS